MFLLHSLTAEFVSIDVLPETEISGGGGRGKVRLNVHSDTLTTD